VTPDNVLSTVKSVAEEHTVEVEVKLRPTISWPFFGVRRPSGTRDQCFFLLEIFFRHLRVCYFVAPSLTRGWVCNLLYNCFWALPEQSLLGGIPAELTTIFYCLIWDSPNLEDQVPIFISSRNRVAQIYPLALGSLLPPLTTLIRLHTGYCHVMLMLPWESQKGHLIQKTTNRWHNERL
jgi:hypothetical protein